MKIEELAGGYCTRDHVDVQDKREVYEILREFKRRLKRDFEIDLPESCPVFYYGAFELEPTKKTLKKLRAECRHGGRWVMFDEYDWEYPIIDVRLLSKKPFSDSSPNDFLIVIEYDG